MQKNLPHDRYIAGPLNLDRTAKRADTTLGAELVLGEKEFDALDVLATSEGKTVALEELIKIVWKGSNDHDIRADARETLKNLAVKIRQAGEGFMWIEYSPGVGYTFRTKWGRSWHYNKPDYTEQVLPEKTAKHNRKVLTNPDKTGNLRDEGGQSILSSYFDDPGESRSLTGIIKPVAALAALAAVAGVTAVIIGISLVATRPADEDFIFNDEPIPLASPDIDDDENEEEEEINEEDEENNIEYIEEE